MKEKILRAIGHRSRQLLNNGKDDLSSKIEMKLIKITMNAIWTASLIKTSLTITRTPTITLRSILKANLNIKNGKKKDNKVKHIVNVVSEENWAIPLQCPQFRDRSNIILLSDNFIIFPIYQGFYDKC